MRVEKKEKEIIEISEKVKIRQENHDLVLEPGDKIKITKESNYAYVAKSDISYKEAIDFINVFNRKVTNITLESRVVYLSCSMSDVGVEMQSTFIVIHSNNKKDSLRFDIKKSLNIKKETQTYYDYSRLLALRFDLSEIVVRVEFYGADLNA